MATPTHEGPSNGDAQPQEADSAVLDKIPNLISAIEENHLKVVPVMSNDGKTVIGYDVNSRGGRQLFRISENDMTYAIVKDTILTAAADKEEVASNFDIMEGVQRSLKRLGMPESEIPRTPHGLAEQTKTLMKDFLDIQKVKSEIDIQNNLQGLMAMTMRVYIGGKDEWEKLPKEMQRLVVEIGEPLVVRATEQLGVGEGTVATAQAMRRISEELTAMRSDASKLVGFGRVMKGLGNGIQGLILGDNDTKGLLPGVVDVASDVTGKTIGHAASALGKFKRGATHWKDNDQVQDGKVNTESDHGI